MPGLPDWTQAVLLKGTDPAGNLVTVAVDANGNIVGVFKGTYDTTLKTIAVDDQGRIIARLDAEALTSPRWYSPGRAVWVDGFEEGMGKWETAGNPLGYSHVISTDFASMGGYSLKMTPAGSGNNQVGITRDFSEPASDRIGLEFKFKIEDELDYLWLQLQTWTATQQVTYRWRYDFYGEELQVYEEPATWTTVATGIAAEYNEADFAPVKLSIDKGGPAYIKGYFGPKEYDLSSYSPDVVGGAYEPLVACQIYYEAYAGSTSPVYIDDVLLTVDEP